MAIKSRPKGSVNDLLGLSSKEISKLSEKELRGIVSKLTDTANKRLKRIQESGLSSLSPIVRAREKAKKGKFTLPERYNFKEAEKTIAKNKEAIHEIQKAARRKDFTEYTTEQIKTMAQLRGENKKLREEMSSAMSSLKEAYAETRSFLQPRQLKAGGTGASTTTMEGIKEYQKNFEEIIAKERARLMENKENLDKRYKKKQVLKKSIEKKFMRDFWDRYEKWREIYEIRNPDKGNGPTNDKDVLAYEDMITEIGEDEEILVSEAEEIYKEFERKRREEWEEDSLEEDYEEDLYESVKPKAVKRVSNRPIKRKGTSGTKRNKSKRPRLKKPIL